MTVRLGKASWSAMITPATVPIRIRVASSRGHTQLAPPLLAQVITIFWVSRLRNIRLNAYHRKIQVQRRWGRLCHSKEHQKFPSVAEPFIALLATLIAPLFTDGL